MRPSAPPLLFWKVSASTTCSRVTLPILVSTRPIGRPWSWSMAGIAVAVAGAAPAADGIDLPPVGIIPGLAAGMPGRAPGAGATGTLLAGIPAAVGGADCPTVGALGVVSPGLFAGIPGAAADPCAVGRCGLGVPPDVPVPVGGG